MEKLRKHLQEKSLSEITEFINFVDPKQNLKPLKCKKDVAISRAMEAAETARANRNKKVYRKVSRRLRAFFV